jgi:hypothetical protein
MGTFIEERFASLPEYELEIQQEMRSKSYYQVRFTSTENYLTLCNYAVSS